MEIGLFPMLNDFPMSGFRASLACAQNVQKQIGFEVGKIENKLKLA